MTSCNAAEPSFYRRIIPHTDYFALPEKETTAIPLVF